MLNRGRFLRYFRGPLIVLLGALTATFCNALEQSEVEKQELRNMMASHYFYAVETVAFSNRVSKDFGLSKFNHPDEIDDIMRAKGYLLLEKRIYGSCFEKFPGCGGGGSSVFQNIVNNQIIVAMNMETKRSPFKCKFTITNIIQAEKIQEQ